MESGTRKAQDIQRQQKRQVRLTIQIWLRGQQTLSEPFLYCDIKQPPHGTNAPCGGFDLLYLHRNIAENRLFKNQTLCSFFLFRFISFIGIEKKEYQLVILYISVSFIIFICAGVSRRGFTIYGKTRYGKAVCGDQSNGLYSVTVLRYTSGSPLRIKSAQANGSLQIR